MVEQQMQQYRNHRTTPFSRDSQEWFRNLDANSLLVIKDPYNPNNNVGRSCFGIYQVRAEWQRALNSIKNFAEKIKNFKKGFYIHLKFEGNRDILEELKEKIKLDKKVIRDLVVKYNKLDLDNEYFKSN